jgi:hypothetical protein
VVCGYVRVIPRGTPCNSGETPGTNAAITLLSEGWKLIDGQYDKDGQGMFAINHDNKSMVCPSCAKDD